jgi:hypothetical protein
VGEEEDALYIYMTRAVESGDDMEEGVRSQNLPLSCEE